MSRSIRALLCLLLVLPAAVPAAADPVDDLLAAAGVDQPGCDAFDPARCLLPWPSDTFTVADPTTGTGLRLDLPVHGMPRNVAGKPIDPREWNRNDGFSPGTALLALVPDLDMTATFGRETTITDPGAALRPDSPVVVVNTRTGARHPVWAELDAHPDTAPEDRLLILRPLTNFDHGDRYVVGLRGLSDGDGPIAPSPAFAQAVADGADRLADVLPVLAAQDVDVDDLVLAWDFTIASAENVTGRALAIRDDAFSQLGDDDLADQEVPTTSTAPAFTVEEVIDRPDDPERVRTVRGTITVPNYLTLPQGTEVPPDRPAATDALPAELTGGYDEATGLAQHAPGSRFLYDAPLPGPMDTPVQNPAASTLSAPFTCTIPGVQEGPAIGMLYGHGLLGGQGESGGGSTERMRERGYAPCAVDWIGMSTGDVLNVATILTDASNFPSLADRAQQGFLNFMFLGRAMIHPDGLTAHEAFQAEDGTPLLTTAGTRGPEPALVYDGNSQGGIMGGALTALSPDVTRATLGVVGMNYSTLLNRSVDWEGKGTEDPAQGDLPAYATFLYSAYPDKVDQQIVFQLIQVLWDRAETNGYAHFLSTALPGSPVNQVLLHPAFGDYQVANVTAEVLARTAGARFAEHALAPGLHWSDDPGFGMAPLEDGCAHRCSALVYWDSGNGVPPDGNVPPAFLDADPHEHPRRDPFSAEQRDRFYRTGVIDDVHDGGPYRTVPFFPVHGFIEGTDQPDRAENPQQ